MKVKNRSAPAADARKGKPPSESFSEYLSEQLGDPAFREAYDQRRTVHEIAAAVRTIRERAGLTQRELARRIGVSQPMIARMESGSDTRTPQVETLWRISRAVGRRLRLSFSGETPKPSAGRQPLIEVKG